MKKLLFVLFVLGLSTQIFAKITAKDVTGSWKYTIETDQGPMTGIIKVIEKEGKLAGNVATGEGTTIPFTKIEIQEEDILYFEVAPDYEVFKVTLKIDGKKFTGTVTNLDVKVSITGEKQE